MLLPWPRLTCVSLNECIADRFACLAERGGVMGGGAFKWTPPEFGGTNCSVSLFIFECLVLVLMTLIQRPPRPAPTLHSLGNVHSWCFSGLLPEPGEGVRGGAGRLMDLKKKARIALLFPHFFASGLIGCWYGHVQEIGWWWSVLELLLLPINGRLYWHLSFVIPRWCVTEMFCWLWLFVLLGWKRTTAGIMRGRAFSF